MAKNNKIFTFKELAKNKHPQQIEKIFDFFKVLLKKETAMIITNRGK